MFLEASSVLHEVLHESDEESETDSSIKVAEETDIQTMEGLLVPRMQSVV